MQWRVLRFNGETRQSVVCVGAQSGVAESGTVAFEYVKGMIAGGLAMGKAVGMARPRKRVLCLGLGGGTLPMFFAQGHHRAGQEGDAEVHAVELDPVVVEAAMAAMGLDQGLVKVHVQDAGDFAKTWAGEKFDLVFLDCFGGDDGVPDALVDPEGPLCAALRGGTLLAAPGVLVVNQHGGLPPPGLAERVTRRFGPGYDPVDGGAHGRKVHRTMESLVGALAGAAGGVGNVAAVTAACQSQDNVLLLAARLGPDGAAAPRGLAAATVSEVAASATSEMSPPCAPVPAPAGLVACLGDAADAAQPPGLSFPLRPRAIRGLHLLSPPVVRAVADP